MSKTLAIVWKSKTSLLLLCLCFIHLPAFADAVDVHNKRIQIALGAEPPDLNTLRATDQVSFFIIEHVMEGLLAYDEHNHLIPGIAEKWEINDKGAIFHLRKNALWSDGVVVTAKDFVFAWQTVVNPQTASRYAFILAPIKNAEKIIDGKMKPESLGVKALDDFTLQVNFERPCAYFLSLTTFGTYFPVRKDFYEKQQERYFADVDNMVFNGPYVLDKWVHGAALHLSKNEKFWNEKQIRINEIDIPYISSDPSVIFNLFRNNEVVSAGLDADNIKMALQERMHIKKFDLGAVFYMEFNHRNERVTSNIHFRKAIQDIFSPEELVYKVIGLPGNKPAHSLFPSWLDGEKDKFYKEYPPEKIKLDIDAARDEIALAEKDLGIKTIPPIVLLASDSPLATKEAEYFQALFKDTLGLDIKIDKQIFKQRLAKLSAGDFDIALSAWGPDYNDPSTFGDLFYSRNANNHGHYKNETYDHWVSVAMNNTDVAIRMKAFSEMQSILIKEAVIIPQFERGIVYVENPHVKNITRRIFGGDPSFRYAYIEENEEQ